MKIFLLYFIINIETYQQLAVDLQSGEYNPISYQKDSCVYLHMDCLKQVTIDNLNLNNSIDTDSVLNQLMKNVHITQSKRQQILKNHHHKFNTFSQAHYHLKTSNINDKENQPRPQSSNAKYLKHTCKMIINQNQIKDNFNRQKTLENDTNNNSNHHPKSLLQCECQQVSQPYLNIREQYVYPSSIVHQRNVESSQGNLSRNEQNNCSIELSQSVQQSQEMLLHHSVSSKFLQSPSLSLGLIESKITKKSTLSHLNNSKNILNIDKNVQNVKNNGNNQSKNEDNKRNENRKQRNINQRGQKKKEQRQKKVQKDISIENLMFFTDCKDISSIKNIQIQKDNQKIRDKQLKLKEKINNLIKKQKYNKIQASTQVQTNSLIPTLIKDQELNNQIVTSYQMEVEYLRKINLIQSMEIQKLRKLLRITTKENQPENIKDNINSNNINIKNKQDKDSNTQTINQINTHYNHYQSLFVNSQVPFHIQHNNNKCISQTTNTKVTSINTKITSFNSVNSINQTQDNFQNYIKNNRNHKPSKKTLIKQDNKNTHPTQSLRSSLLSDPMASSLLNDLNFRNMKDKMKDNKHRVSLNEMDINSTLTFNKHNLSCNNQSTCKKYNESTCKKLNKKTKKLGSSCQRQVMSVSKQTKNKQSQVMFVSKQMNSKQNIECRTLWMKKREHNKGKKKKTICSVDLLESIKKQLYNEGKRK